MTTYSNSKLSAYEECPYAYKLRYIDKIKSKQSHIALFLGSAVHEVMEKLYNDVKMTKIPDLQELIDFYHYTWDKWWAESEFKGEEILVTNEGLTREHYRQKGEKCVRMYYERYKPFEDGVIISCEWQAHFSLDKDGQYKMTGVIDRLMKNNQDEYEIHDYKTSKNPPEQDDLDNDRQLALYQIGVQKRFPDAKKIHLIWHYVAHDLEFKSSRTPEQLEELKNKTRRLIDRIEQDKTSSPNPKDYCKQWCEYHESCPAFGHEIKVEQLPENEFLNEDGVKLVNLRSKLVQEKSELDGEWNSVKEKIDKIDEALIDYARKQKVTRVVGTKHQWSFSKGTELKLPGKHDPERKKIESVLHNLELWDDYSTIDETELRHAIEGGRLNKKHLKKIQPFIETKTKSKISFTKRKEE